jgi:hypothetical protein
MLYLHGMFQDFFPSAPPPVPVSFDECTVISAPPTAAACSDFKTKHPPSLDMLKCFKCDQMGHFACYCPHTKKPLSERSNVKCANCSRSGHLAEAFFYTACLSTVVPVTSIQSTSAQPSNAVSSAPSLPSRPLERRSMTTTSTYAQTQTSTAATLPTTSVYKWSNRDNPCVNTPRQRQIPPPQCTNRT